MATLVRRCQNHAGLWRSSRRLHGAFTPFGSLTDRLRRGFLPRLRLKLASCELILAASLCSALRIATTQRGSVSFSTFAVLDQFTVFTIQQQQTLQLPL